MPEWSGKPEDFCEDMDKTPGVGPGHCGCMESRPGGLMSAGSAGIFVYRVQKKLRDVYEKMVGRDSAYVEFNDFQREVGACVVHFWVWGHDKTWASKNVEDDAALAIITEEVRPRLERAAGMDKLKKMYSAAAQEAFDDLLRYVREWYGTDAATRTGTDAAARTNGGDEVRKLIDDLQRVLHEYDV